MHVGVTAHVCISSQVLPVPNSAAAFSSPAVHLRPKVRNLIVAIADRINEVRSLSLPLC